MAEFCKQCTEELFGKKAASMLHYPMKDDEFLVIICEGCGRSVRVLNDYYRIECNTCKYGQEGTCDNCSGAEGHTTEVVGVGLCKNYQRKHINSRELESRG